MLFLFNGSIVIVLDYTLYTEFKVFYYLFTKTFELFLLEVLDETGSQGVSWSTLTE